MSFEVLRCGAGRALNRSVCIPSTVGSHTRVHTSPAHIPTPLFFRFDFRAVPLASPLGRFSAQHEEQLKAYLRFFRSKREYQLQEVEATIRDQKESLFEDMYTQDDVSRILSSLADATRGTVMTDLQNTVNMGVLVLRQLFEEAEAQDAELELDLSVVEDESECGVLCVCVFVCVCVCVCVV